MKDALAATEERGYVLYCVYWLILSPDRRLAATLADKTDELGMAAEGMAAQVGAIIFVCAPVLTFTGQAQKLAAKTQTKKRRFGF